MNIMMAQESLQEYVRVHGRNMLEHQQVAKRLKELLPGRLVTLKHRLRAGERTAAAAERRAFVDPRYTHHIDEYLKVLQESLAARIQYETHQMLMEARASLRPFRARR